MEKEKIESYLSILKSYKRSNKDILFFENEDQYFIFSFTSLESISKLLRIEEVKRKNYSYIQFPIKGSRKYIDILNIHDYHVHIIRSNDAEITKYEAKSMIEIYFDYVSEYEAKYGKETLVLIQVGGFFEFYGVDNESEKIGNARVIADMLNITLSRRDKSILENSRKNALMAGFPIANLRKYLQVLIQQSYTVVLIEHTSPAPDPLRDITHIYSPSTYIDDIYGAHDGNMFVSIYMSEHKGVYSCGMSAIDVSTGTSHVYHVDSGFGMDKQALLEDVYRFIENFNPKEILFTSFNLTSFSKGEINKLFGSSHRVLHNDYNQLDESYLKVSYLNSVLEKVYKHHGILSGIEYVHLEKYPDTVVSFVNGIQWVYDHDPFIIEKIQIPQIYEYHKHLILYHNAAYQLNLIHTHKEDTKYKSLYDIIQKTSTPMGRRKLKYDLLNPITNIDRLNRSYEKIAKMTDYKYIEGQLSALVDMERYHRKMVLKMLHPQEFSSLYYTYITVSQLMEYDGIDLNDYDITIQDKEDMKSLLKYIEQNVDVKEMGKYNLNDITSSFFQHGVSKKVDDLQAKIHSIETYMNSECTFLNDEIKKREPSCDAAVKIEETGGVFYMSTTKRRSELLSKETAAKYQINKGTGSNVRITSDLFIQQSDLLIAHREMMKSVIKSTYIQFKEELLLQYGQIMDKICVFIADLDVIKSHKKCALLYGYVRPSITPNENRSYINVKGLRHPIIEVIEDSKAYISNDISIGNTEIGFLLYGVNGVGKSSLGKALGIAIIMAQMGMYVPCKELTYYPYTKIFTRINGDDNIFKGMSSFVVEMNELRSILKYANERSIVLGDEVCKGTEETSALSIVASTIQRFSQKRISFILATHFHKLYDLLQNGKTPISGISFKHLSIEIDKKSRGIIYGRKLMDGMGSTNYGLDIARFILEDEDFMVQAKSIRDEILEIEDKIVSPNVSNYHKDMYVHECAICGKTAISTQLDTHHIIEQHEFDEYKMKDGIQKDARHNLVVLCKEHHDAVHHGNLRIHGYKMGVHGRILDYEFVEHVEEKIEFVQHVQHVQYVEEEKKEPEAKKKSVHKKYDSSIVKSVITLGEEYKDQLNQIKIVQSMINQQTQIVIPIATIKKMISGNY